MHRRSLAGRFENHARDLAFRRLHRFPQATDHDIRWKDGSLGPIVPKEHADDGIAGAVHDELDANDGYLVEVDPERVVVF